MHRSSMPTKAHDVFFHICSRAAAAQQLCIHAPLPSLGCSDGVFAGPRLVLMLKHHAHVYPPTTVPNLSHLVTNVQQRPDMIVHHPAAQRCLHSLTPTHHPGMAVVGHGRELSEAPAAS
jgi:hypothetical protein